MRRRIPNRAILVVAVALAGVAGGVALNSLPPPIASPSPSFVAASPTISPTVFPTLEPTVAATRIDPGPPSGRVTAFYYGWYGTPTIDGRWRHWGQGGHTPPDDLGAAFQPALGPYSSHDPAVLARHMQDLLAARVGTIAVSWWGPGSFDDVGLPAIVDAAGAVGIGVALHIEPYNGRTGASIARDIRAFIARYGDSPGLARAVRATKFGTSATARPIIYVYLPREVNEAALRDAIDGLRGTPSDAIVLIQTTDVALVDRLHADGLYSYDVYALDGTSFDRLLTRCRDRNYLCSPSVGPGYDERRATPGDRAIDRARGARYDMMWERATAASAEWVSITSFNEWHEGTQIEPALTPGATGYLDYEGAYGRSGPGAEAAYLDATALWVGRLEGH